MMAQSLAESFMDIQAAFKLIGSKLDHWLRELIRLIPNILLAAVILAIGLLLARLVKKVVGKFLHRAIHNVTLSSLFTSIIYFVFIGIVLFSVLSVLKLDKAVTSILAGAGLLG